MEEVFSKYGIAGVCVLLTIMILVRVGEFVLALRKEKDSASEAAVRSNTTALQESTIAVRELKARLEAVERAIGELPKMKTDVRRFYAAIKEVAGKEKWPAIRDEILKDDFTL